MTTERAAKGKSALQGVTIRESYTTGKSRIYGKQRKSEEIKKTFWAAGSLL